MGESREMNLNTKEGETVPPGGTCRVISAVLI